MKVRRFAKPIAAAILVVGFLSAGVAAPASAASSGGYRVADTGWDRK